MASLISLPNELLDFVTSHLEFQDKVNLIKTCRTIQIAITPSLYRTVVIDMKASETEHRLEGCIRSLQRVSNLLFTLITRPGFNKHVRGLQVRNYYTALANVDLSATEVRAYSQAVEKHCASLKAHWEEALAAKHNSSAVLSLVLLHCPRLERLTIPGHLLDIGGWLQQFLLYLSFNQNSVLLRNLSSITVVSGDTKDVGLLQAIPEWLAPLPSLQTIDLSVEDDHVGPSRQWNFPFSGLPTPGKLSTLRILRTGAQFSVLSKVLQHTPFLHTLVLDIRIAASTLPGNLSQLRTGLDLLKSTLTHFVFRLEKHNDEDDWEPYYGTAFEDGVGLGSLRNFGALETLEIALISLVGHEAAVWYPKLPSLAEYLPPDLRSLTLSDDLWDHESFHVISALPTMAVLKEFLAGERMSGNWMQTEPSNHGEWIKTGDPAWIHTTPYLQELNFDVDNLDGCNSTKFWRRPGSYDALQNMCDAQGFRNSIRRQSDL